MLTNIPDKGQVTTRYCGWYANRPPRRRAGGVVVAFSFVVDLTFLHGRQQLAGTSVDVIVEY